MSQSAQKTAGLAGLVLAAGESSRLGQPKQLVEFRGETLLAHALKLAVAACDAGVTVVTGAPDSRVDELLEDDGVRQVPNTDWQQGMGTSIAAGITAMRAQPCAGIMLMLCDQPLISPADIEALVSAWRDSPLRPAAAGYRGGAGVPAVFPVSFVPELAALTGDTGAKALLRAAAAVSIVDMPAAHLDIDSADDLQKLENMERTRR